MRLDALSGFSEFFHKSVKCWAATTAHTEHQGLSPRVEKPKGQKASASLQRIWCGE